MVDADLRIDKYTVKLLEPLGHGEFGTAYRAYRNDKWYAAKKVEGKDNEDSSAEIKLLGYGKISHINIMKMIDFFHIKHDVWLIFELASGDLNKFFKIGRRILDTKAQISRQIIDALSYLHGNSPPVIHRGITPGYILYYDETDLPLIKISGFFRAQFYEDAETAPQIPLDEYKAPECHAKKPWGLSSDVFAVAMVMLAMLQHNDESKRLYPRSESQEYELNSSIGIEMIRNPNTKVVEFSQSLPEKERKYRQLIADMALCDPEKRPSAAECQKRINEIVSGHRKTRTSEEGSSTTPMLPSTRVQITHM